MKTQIAFLGSLVLISACSSEPTGLDKQAFPSAMGAAVCGWAFNCCDTSEVKVYSSATDAANCAAQMTSTYADLFNSADPNSWNALEAEAVVAAVNAAAAACPKAYDPAQDLAAHPKMVASTRQPGDTCSTTWECTTRFCRQGTCANPLPEGAACLPTEPCLAPLRCIASGGSSVCKAMQVDGAACSSGGECYSGACGDAKCVVSPNYTCDGKL